MFQISVYLRVYYPDSEYKKTYKRLFNENKTLFECKRHWICAKNVLIPIFHDRLSSLCNTFDGNNDDQKCNILSVE